MVGPDGDIERNGKSEGMSTANEPLVWLVKSGDVVTGPFSSEEISKKLLTKEIVAIDEISTPLSRWRYVRDEPQFATVVEEFRRNLMQSREDTEVQGHANSTEKIEPTVSNPQMMSTLNVTPPDEIEVVTGEVRLPDESEFRAAEIKEAEFTEQVMNRSNSAPALENANSVRQYGLNPGEQKATRGPRGARPLTWVLLAIFAGCLTYAVVHLRHLRTQSTESIRAVIDPAPIRQSADSAWNQARFDEAMERYSQLSRLEDQGEALVRLAVLNIRNGNTVEAKRRLESAQPLLAADHKDLAIATGLSAMKGDDWATARASFQQVMAQPEGGDRVSVAVFNLGVTDYLTKSWSDAAVSFGRVLKTDNSPLALPAALMLARTAIESENSELVTEAIGALDAQLDKPTTHDFRQEAFLMRALLEIQSGRKESASQHVRAALDIDPELTDDHFHDPFAYLAALAWGSLTSSCQKIQSELSSAESEALLAYCLVKSGLKDQSSQALGEALSRAPDKPILHAVNAYTLSQSGREEDALASLQLATRQVREGEKPPPLALFTEARLCERRGDITCVERIWTELAAQDPPQLAGLVYTAKSKLAANDSAGAADDLNRVAELSPRYLPLVRIRAESK